MRQAAACSPVLGSRATSWLPVTKCHGTWEYARLLKTLGLLWTRRLYLTSDGCQDKTVLVSAYKQCRLGPARHAQLRVPAQPQAKRRESHVDGGGVSSHEHAVPLFLLLSCIIVPVFASSYTNHES